jgi:hypothetical protein
MSADPQKPPPKGNGSAPGGNPPRRYAPTTDGETVPGVHYEGMLSMMRSDVVDLSASDPQRKNVMLAWYTGTAFIGYLPTENHVTIFEMDIEQMREQFIGLLEQGWTVDCISDDFKDAIIRHAG